MINHKILGLLVFIVTLSNANSQDSKKTPGLTATYSDSQTSVSEIVNLPDIGIDSEETVHSTISNDFEVIFDGFISIEKAGKYQFYSQYETYINNKVVNQELELKDGLHRIELRYKRVKGPVSTALYWQSEHFIKEPVPPAVFFTKETTQASVKASEPSPSMRIKQLMEKNKCYTCHDEAFLSTIHHKFNKENLLSLITHTGSPKWHQKPLGPKIKQSKDILQLVTALQKLPFPQNHIAPIKANLEKGKMMVGAKGGFACIACHDLKEHRANAESKGPNLSSLKDRISYDWFVRWMNNPGHMKPGVPMPAFFAAQKEKERNQSLANLWKYLEKGNGLPAELLTKDDQFTIKPSKAPIVSRNYLRLPDGREITRALCVSLPEGISFCFDADSCQIVYVWTSGFLDMTDHWRGKSLHPVKVIGKSLYEPTAEEGLHFGSAKPVFKGYALSDGVLSLEFSVQNSPVTLQTTAIQGQLSMTYNIKKAVENLTFTGPASGPASISSSTGSWENNILKIKKHDNLELTLTLKKRDLK